MDSELQDTITEYADQAVALARGTFQVDLDFSPESVSKVEDILDGMYRHYNKKMLGIRVGKRLSEEELVSHSQVWGCYIGEIFRREFDGEWYWETGFGPEPQAGLRVGENRIFPPSKVYKRLTNGPEDNLCFYYSVMSQELAKK